MLRSRSTPAEIVERVRIVRYELFRGTRIRVLEIGFGRHRDHLMKELRSADRRDLEQRRIAVQLRRTGPRELARQGLRLALHETEPVHQMERDHLERGDDLGVGEDLLPELMSDLTSDLHMEDTTWQHSIQDLIVPPVAVIEPYRYEGSVVFPCRKRCERFRRGGRGPDGCSSRPCPWRHDEKRSLTQLLALMQSTKKSLESCMYLITHPKVRRRAISFILAH